MKSIGRALIVVVSLAMPGSTSAAEPLHLEDAVRQALANNERGLKAPLRVDVAEGGLERARSAFFPTLVLGASTSLTPSKTSGLGTLTLTQPLLHPSPFPLYPPAQPHPNT